MFSNKTNNQPQVVYVSLGRKLPHVYTTVERAYDGITRLFPKGAKVLAGEQILGDLSLEVLEDNIVLHGMLKISTMTYFSRLIRTYIDDIMPEKENI